jgi:hypothetical protein
MAAVVAAQVTVLYNEGDASVGERIMVFRVRNVATGDTFDVAQWFVKVRAGTFLSSGERVATIGTVGVGGTTLTLTQAAAVNDTMILTVIGSSA